MLFSQKIFSFFEDFKTTDLVTPKPIPIYEHLTSSQFRGTLNNEDISASLQKK